MRVRIAVLVAAGAGVAAFMFLRPESPIAGSDCEVLSTGLLREPVNALSALALVGAGWVLARRHLTAGTALLAAGAVSFAAHASAHSTARALDGIAAGFAAVAIGATILRAGIDPRRLRAAAALTTAGLALWALSRSTGPWCDALGPTGHAAWHFLIAAAALVAIHKRRRPDQDSQMGS